MSNVIDFLESMGQNAQLRYATSDEVEQALARAQITTELQAAILGNDSRALEALLDIQANVCCALHAPEDEPEEDEDDGKDDDQDDQSDEDDAQ